MEKLFVIPVNQEDGTPAYPLPHQDNFGIIVSDNVFAKMLPPVGSRVALCFTKEARATLTLREEPEFLINTFTDIALKATITSIEEQDDYWMLFVDVGERLHAREFTLEDKIWLNENVAQIHDGGDNQDITDLIQRMMILIRAAEIKIPTDYLARTQRSQSVDYLAQAVLAQDDDDIRLEYICSTDKVNQLNILAASLTDTVQIRKGLNKVVVTATPKSKAKPQTIPERIADLPLTEETAQYIEREVNKYKQLQQSNQSASEFGAVSDYLNWVLELPWETYQHKSIALPDLSTRLNASHYGLADVKRHILELFAIEHITRASIGHILCFVGPPGSGKTSIARDIALASNRPIVPIALGGISDESEIRGNRRLFVGSRPGRVITGLKKAKCLDPVFLLDEIDKISSSRQDPAYALLELLDREQNHSFIDRYMEVPVDLSKAVFICTANDERAIPVALKDRLEMVTFREYTREERSHILREFIIPKATTGYNLSQYNIEFSEPLLQELTAIKQVRALDQTVRKLLRFAAATILLQGLDTFKLSSEHLSPLKVNATVGF